MTGVRKPTASSARRSPEAVTVKAQGPAGSRVPVSPSKPPAIDTVIGTIHPDTPHNYRDSRFEAKRPGFGLRW